MKRTIRLTEEDLKCMVHESINRLMQEDYLNEGKFSRAVGTAALGGMLAFGGGNLNAKPTDNTQSYAQTQNPVQTKGDSNVNFYNLIETNMTEDTDTGDMIANYQLVYRFDSDAKTMFDKLIDNYLGTYKLNVHLLSVFGVPNVIVKEVDGMYKIEITYNEGPAAKKKQRVTTFTIYLKDGVFKIIGYRRQEKPYGGFTKDLIRLYFESPKTVIEKAARYLTHVDEEETTENDKEIDIRSEFDF